MFEKLENLSAILLIAVLIANIVIIATHKKPTKEDFDPIVPDVHIMKEGETLYSISRKYYPDLDPRYVVAVLRELNDIDNPGRIQIGQKIILK